MPRRRNMGTKHYTLFRLTVTSSDGVECSVNIPCKMTKDPPYKSTFNQIAGVLRVDPDDILEVLRTWTREQLREHLGTFSHAELRRPNLR